MACRWGRAPAKLKANISKTQVSLDAVALSFPPLRKEGYPVNSFFPISTATIPVLLASTQVYTPQFSTPSSSVITPKAIPYSYVLWH